MKPLFSVIIPSLNEEKFLPRLLSDLQNQKLKNFEIIVIDACSSDNTIKNILRFKQTLPLRIFKAKRHNVSFSRNFGAEKAKGEYLVFLDADVQIYSSFIKNLNKAVNNNKGLLFIPRTVPDEKDQQMEVIFRIVSFLTEMSQYVGKPFSNGGSMVVEKNFFNRIGRFDEKLFLAEDHNLIQRAQLWGVRAKFLNHLKIKFSLRRMKKEGKLEAFYKYLVATAYILIKGDIKKEIFDYQMGGAEYKKLKNKISFTDNMNNYSKIIKEFFSKLLSS
ncbi:MAG: Glycosyl transferase family 2 [Candidatus Roizmanbacteria bacterium GW2011_GWC2_37_13]|uniref:Glycosyl transferase family 2 n=1 Tax=Candidatus Roizmanbacteria bacterium GW2011_GWC2_37_13 TaxID=1618486 RepID=A0A0G0J8R7_9BACT|nr:MAG: Glycosyl transferase family 2 [Candidatus Roizmanbacteria bacterium GW2011_GWC1_37_12]KKQ24441.1 MAG: Glycosyl transferase family 2 [Candidatus Roizmanbacteria bacterium GW2011_GWC2_37_13]